MRRVGPGFVNGLASSTRSMLAILTPLLLAACGSDSSGTPGGSSAPSLQVRATSACAQNTLPVVTAQELIDKTMEVATVSVTGYDNTRSSGELATGTNVFLYVGNEQGKPGGDGGAFTSTVDDANPAGKALTPDVPYTGGALQDGFFCTKEGIHRVYAGVKNYEPTGQAIIMNASDGFPIVCKNHDKWLCDCLGQCGEVDAAPADAVVDAAPVDAVAPDATRTDAATDAVVDAGPDMEAPPSVWQIAYDNPTDAPALSLSIRANNAPGAKSRVVLTWKVTHNGQPPGVPVHVDFSLKQPSIPGVVIDPAFSLSDAEGLVSTVLQTGNTPGQVTIVATARFPGVECAGDACTENSPPISISSGLPSLNEFHFVCHDPVISAFTNRVFDFDLAPPIGDRWLVGLEPGTSCSAQLGDRLRNPIDEGTIVRFTTEAGSVQGALPTNADGTAVTNYQITVPVPNDVAPNAYEQPTFSHLLDPNQGIILNPRDGLVRLVASTRGEEGFFDVDGDNQYTDGVDTLRPGDDLGEPYIDANDNNQWDDNESYDDVDGDQQYTVANLSWDANTVIWRSTVLLWTGALSDEYSYFGGAHCDPGSDHCSPSGCAGDCSFQPLGSCPAGLDLYINGGGEADIQFIPRDKNGNCLDSRERSTVAIAASITSPVGATAPSFAESGAPTWTEQTHGCFVEGVPEMPVGSSYVRHLVAARVQGAPGQAVPPFIGVLKFDVAAERPDRQVVTRSIFINYCINN